MSVRIRISFAPATFGLPGLETTTAILSTTDISEALRIPIEPRPIGMVEIAITNTLGETVARASNQVPGEISFGGLTLQPGDYGLVLTDKAQSTAGQRRGGFAITQSPPPRPDFGAGGTAISLPRGVSNDILALWLSCVGPTTNALRAYQLVRSETNGLEKATLIEAIAVADKVLPKTAAQCAGEP